MRSRLVQGLLFSAVAALGLAAATSAPAHAQSVDVRVGLGHGSFHAQLSSFGRWASHPTYGAIFYPARRDFVPYTYGHWVTDDQGASVWLSDEPHGWATEHYGRWIQTSAGWAWIPGDTYAPAWVAWGESDDGLAWAPLGPDERACGDWRASYAGRGVTIIRRPRAVLRYAPRFEGGAWRRDADGWRRDADAWRRARHAERRYPDRWNDGRVREDRHEQHWNRGSNVAPDFRDARYRRDDRREEVRDHRDHGRRY